jgi:vesicle transport through interaction with t-SNAREs 1
MDSTPTALFESYESDFKHLLEGLKEKLENAGTGGECAAVSQCLERVESLLETTARSCAWP